MAKKLNKKVIILNGSPRPKGNTSQILGLITQSLAKRKFDYKQHDLYKLDYRGCTHCDACRKNANKNGCILKDDLTEILDDIEKANIIIIASPVYCWSVTGCMNAALDRFYSFFKEKKSLLAKKQMLGVLTCGGDYFDGMDLCVQMLKSLCDFGETEYLGTFAVANCGKPKELNKRTLELKKAAESLIKEM